MQRWNGTGTVLEQMRSGGHSFVFRNYTFDENGNIDGFMYTDNHGGERLEIRDTNATYYGVNLNDND